MAEVDSSAERQKGDDSEKNADFFG